MSGLTRPSQLGRRLASALPDPLIVHKLQQASLIAVWQAQPSLAVLLGSTC